MPRAPRRSRLSQVRSVIPRGIAWPTLVALLVVSLGTVALRAQLATRARVVAETGASAGARAPRFEREIDVRTFQRGSVHSHSAMSDGDAPASTVLRWYRESGYQFLALTDHNRHFDPDRYAQAERDGLVLLPGEEVTLAAEGLPVHVNAICTQHGIGGQNFSDRRIALRWAVAQIAAQGGISIINHPNFHWALDAELIAEAPDATMLEIFSGHGASRWAGDARHPAAEELWHALLTTGSNLVPAAVDDAHHYTSAPRPRGSGRALPGTGWVVTYAPEHSRPAICEALRRGDLYASNGPKLERLRVVGDTISVWLSDETAMVEFIGASAAEGQAAFPSPSDGDDGLWMASYRLRGAESFVRVRVTTAGGHQAWTRAFRVAL